MAEIAVVKPVFHGLNETQSVAVAKKSDAVFKGGDLIIVASGLADDFAGGSSAVGLCVAGEPAVQPEAPAGSPNTGVVNVLLLHDQVHAEMNLVGTFAADDVGKAYGLSAATYGVPYVLKSDTTNTRVKVIQLIEGEVGDTNVRVKVRFIPGATTTNIL